MPEKTQYEFEEAVCENILQVRIKHVMPSEDSDEQYAFYLMRGSEKEQIIWYQNSNSASFALRHNGIYRIMYFVKRTADKRECVFESGQIHRYETAENCTKVNFQEINLSIYGSCVTRDVLECVHNAERIMKLKSYVARQSVIAAVTEPLSIDETNVKLDSAFQKKMVLGDFRKNWEQLFAFDGSEYLIIDLIDERFDLLRIGKTYLTLSNELETSGILQNLVQNRKNSCMRRMKKRARWNRYYVGFREIREYIQLFARRLKRIYPENRIIIHVVRMQDFYLDAKKNTLRFPQNHLNNNKRLNRMLGYMYGCLQECLPEAHIIDVSSVYLADENHKWGLSPMHYQAEYYERVFEEIMRKVSQLQ